MNTPDPITTSAARMRHGATFAAALATLPLPAHAADDRKPVCEVVAAFGLLVVAATVASIAIAWRQRRASNRVAQTNCANEPPTPTPTPH